jgi:putative endonuclease
MSWYVYILETRDGRLYTGATNDLERRMRQHQAGQGAAFTRAFKFKKLRYSEEHPDRSSALKREKHIQHLSRAAKLSLIRRLSILT